MLQVIAWVLGEYGAAAEGGGPTAMDALCQADATGASGDEVRACCNIKIIPLPFQVAS